ncbi:MAG: hypothetical protein RML45_01360 [Acetobacteraceae bacterium]|nr:hypothetical protein [Acetobacteraceae bacterium]
MHEVFIRRDLKPEGQRSEETIAAIASYHTLSGEVGAVAAEADVGLLILTHFVPTRFDAEALIAEVRATWSGPLVLGEDLMRYDLASRTLEAGSAMVALPR